MVFQDRQAAGRALGSALGRLRPSRPLILALPRGGVPVGRAVCESLDADLDILLVRKLGVPWQPELAMGAIGESGVRVLNRDVLDDVRLTEPELTRVERHERAEMARRATLWRGNGNRISAADRVTVIVDDGMATGATAVAACRVVRSEGPRILIVAMPVSSPTAAQRLKGEADDVVCLTEPVDMGGVGAAYRDFHQLDDQEVIELLRV